MPGVDDDDTIRVYGSGGADPEGNKPGDLYVTVKVRPDPVFRREKSDIHVDAVLNITQVTDFAEIMFFSELTINIAVQIIDI
ncbi:chaperone protein dnaJ GFA2, mitochondrial-like [Phalaenopsis equestris]|uniref:chaperone protein dnaJ GFA2, mitochondrial-like n=1 Tax=Phalaenopsis equestris TaxID=78828 RepID=UPI0009E5C37A|nr:chaperone protein dnaJ GFA2, mitochondrial-like [Phalaenopsis equestris]